MLFGGCEGLELDDEVEEDEGELDDEFGLRRRCVLEFDSGAISIEDEDEMGGTAVQPLIELCPDELPELPLLVKGGKGMLTLC